MKILLYAMVADRDSTTPPIPLPDSRLVLVPGTTRRVPSKKVFRSLLTAYQGFELPDGILGLDAAGEVRGGHELPAKRRKRKSSGQGYCRGRIRVQKPPVAIAAHDDRRPIVLS
jgi:hypothetical protein